MGPTRQHLQQFQDIYFFYIIKISKHYDLIFEKYTIFTIFCKIHNIYKMYNTYVLITKTVKSIAKKY